ncbi:class I glutamine amidotransferase-like protein [Hypoxylon sp. FL1150]|nr:class I glutamine amidotransferase-like protein [Hypoxylon sp. FL1150]
MTVTLSPRVVHVAILECFTMPHQIAATRGQFGDVFRSWLCTSAKALNAGRSLGDQVEIQTSVFDVQHGQYPQSLDNVDAIIVTGSTSSAYDNDPWIITLERFLQDAYAQKPHIKLFGGCFGHQLLSQALLGSYGTFVKKNPNGWEIGVHEINLNPDFRADFARLLREENLSCQFLHADHVVIDNGRLPPSWMNIGSSKLCQVQGIYSPGRVLTYQGHPEFDTFINEHGTTHLGESGILSGSQVEGAMLLIHQKDTATLCGQILLEFITM